MSLPQLHTDRADRYITQHGLERIFTRDFADLSGLSDLAEAISTDDDQANREPALYDLRKFNEQMHARIGGALLRVTGSVYIYNYYQSHGWGPSDADHDRAEEVDLPAAFLYIDVRRFCYRTPEERERKYTQPYLAYSFQATEKDWKMPGFAIPTLDIQAEVSIEKVAIAIPDPYQASNVS